MVREASQRDRRQPPGMAAPATTARANVNLALVKYWGKRDRALNLPATGSISLTLEGLSVEASVAFGGGEADRVEIDGVEAAGEEVLRVVRFLDLVRAEAGRRERALVATRSTVPRGVGLASSAAAFAALARAATSPFYPAWVAGAEADLAQARAAIRARDLEAVGLLAEHSALKMHAVGMAARPPLLYWRGATVDCLDRVWKLRAEGTPAFVTIDAGPQVKVLCTPDDARRVAEALRAVPGVERVLTCAPGGGAEAMA